MNPNSALTTKWNGITQILNTEAGVSIPFSLQDVKDQKINVDIKNYKAIWDTGATFSVITSKVVKEVDLKPIGITRVHTANGEAHQKQYLINLYLPNKVVFGLLRVTEAPLYQTDILIGMDIISKGDFCLSNLNNETILTFRIPSCKKFDFVEEHRIVKLPRAERRRLEKDRAKI